MLGRKVSDDVVVSLLSTLTVRQKSFQMIVCVHRSTLTFDISCLTATFDEIVFSLLLSCVVCEFTFDDSC